MGKHWGITAFLTTPQGCATALATASSATAVVPSGFPGGAQRWQQALRELEGSRLANEPASMSEAGQEALLELMGTHARAAGELTCPDAQFREFRGFLSTWLGWLADPSPNPARIMPGAFLGWRGSDESPIGSFAPAMIQALPAARAQSLIERLRSPWGPKILALLDGIRSAAKPGEHAVLLTWVDDDDDDDEATSAAPMPHAQDMVERHYTQGIEWLLQNAVVAGASDLVLTVGLSPQLVVDGRREGIPGPTVQRDRIMAIAKPVLTDSQIATLERTGFLRMSFGVFQLGRMRWTMTSQRGAYLIQIRFLPALANHWSLDGCGYRVDTNLRPGLVLVTGHACSGRSTTAHAIIDAYNRAGRWRIATIEEPIEGVHSDQLSVVTQYGIGESEDLRSHGIAVAAVLDAKPDLVLIDHIDSRERQEAACLLVRSGALVISTVLGADAEAALLALFHSVPSSVAMIQAVIESRWTMASGGSRRLERTTLDGPALTGLRTRYDVVSGQDPSR